MYSVTVLATLFAGAAMAVPAVDERQAVAYEPCRGIYNSAQCCAVDVDHLVSLDCNNPPAVPTNETDFKTTCAGEGREPRCCILPLLNQGLFCKPPGGT